MTEPPPMYLGLAPPAPRGRPPRAACLGETEAYFGDVVGVKRLVEGEELLDDSLGI